jgi:hypothetical protein
MLVGAGEMLLQNPNAKAQHSDIFVTRVGNQAVVGGANALGTVDENYDLTTRLFESVLVADFPPFDPADFGRDEPGLVGLGSGDPAFPAGSSELPGNAAVSINFPPFALSSNVDSLFFWDGSGAVDFQPVSIAQPAVGASVSNSPISLTGADGELHVHVAFELDNGGAGVPSDGVYLVAPTVSVTGLVDSAPFYMVWLVDSLIVDEEAAEIVEEAIENGMFEAFGKNFQFFEEASEFVHGEFVVPEPASFTLSLVGLIPVAWGIRRRRNRRNEVQQ